MNKYITEFIGTFFLTMTIALTGNPLAIGVVLVALVYMGAHISGAQYNPAVALGVFLRGKMAAKDLVPYMLFQIAGAFAAAVVCYLMLDKTSTPLPGPGVVIWKVLLAEILFTMLLVLVVLKVATAKGTAGNSYFGLAIGLTVMASAFAIGPISGAALNPAVAIGLIAMDAIRGGTSIANIWIYIVGPLAGAALAAGLFKVMDPKDV
jgi:aquaporin Z